MLPNVKPAQQSSAPSRMLVPAAPPCSISTPIYNSRNRHTPEQYYQELFRPTTVTTVTAGKPAEACKNRTDSHETKSKGAPVTMKTQVLTETEFDSLPPSIQRKYFSTLERLRIADGAATSSSGRSSPASTSRPSTSSSSRPGHSRAISRVEQADVSRSRTRLRRRPSGREDYALNQLEAQWFMALPEKIKRQHFSREEQALLTKQCDTVIMDPADEALLRSRSRTRTISETREGATSSISMPSHSNPELIVGSRWDPERRPSDPTMSTSPGYSETIGSQLRRPPIQRNRSLNTFGPFPSTPTNASRPATHAGRSASITTLTNAPQPSTPREVPTVFYRDADVRKKLRLYLGSPQKFDEAVEFGFPSTMQTTEDEINPLEKSLQQPPHGNRILNNDLQRFLAGTQDSLAFLDISDETSAFLEDEEDNSDNRLDNLIDDHKGSLVADTSSVSDLEDPSTPSSELDDQFEMVGPTPGHYLPSKKPSLASMKSSATPTSTTSSTLTPTPTRKRKPSDPEPPQTNKPLPPSPSTLPLRPRPSDSYERALLSNREMTLRLTLTRPDLRAADEDIYGWQNEFQHSYSASNTNKKLRVRQLQLNADPLALEDLPPLVEDERGAMGAFGGRRGAVVKVRKLMGMK
ncbi:MAG: hypothetical protein Q9157_006303 [Trypethelium eluteriae]